MSENGGGTWPHRDATVAVPADHLTILENQADATARAIDEWLGIAGAVYATSGTTEGSPEFVAMAWLAAVSPGLTPTWFFLGLERLRLVSSVVLALRVLAAALTFVLVQDVADAWVVMALFTGSAVQTAVFSIALLFSGVELARPRLLPALSAIRSGSALFGGTAGLTLYTSMNVVLLGFLGARAQVAYFSAAERVVRACIQLLQLVATAIYPRVTYLVSAGDARRAMRLLSRARPWFSRSLRSWRGSR